MTLWQALNIAIEIKPCIAEWAFHRVISGKIAQTYIAHVTFTIRAAKPSLLCMKFIVIVIIQ
jgi:hypothetical protein